MRACSTQQQCRKLCACVPYGSLGWSSTGKSSMHSLAARVGSCEGCCNRQFSSSFPCATIEMKSSPNRVEPQVVFGYFCLWNIIFFGCLGHGLLKCSWAFIFVFLQIVLFFYGKVVIVVTLVMVVAMVVVIVYNFPQVTSPITKWWHLQRRLCPSPLVYHY